MLIPFAHLVMEFLITDVERDLNFNLPFLKLYVDDTILACPESKINTLLDKFNSYHPKLKFTFEKETDGKIAFLDTTVIRNNDGSLSTDWYIKPSSSGRVLNFLSAHSTTHKIGTVKNIAYRAFMLSSPEFHKKNEDRVKSILIKNNYPKSFLNRILNEFKCKMFSPELTKSTNQTVTYHKFPFIKGLSNQIQKNICKERPHCRLAFYNTNTVATLYSKLKDPVPKELMSGLVYKIPCHNCPKCYVGSTKQYLKNRVYQHSYDCREYNRNKPEKTALAQHHFSTGHSFNFDEVSILDRENNYFKRCLGEMICITLNNSVNNRTDVQGLSVQYTNLLHLHKKQ